jgi:hypothetical protein
VWTLIARSFSATAALLALVVTVVGGAIAPGHSHAANYISELGARGAAHGEVVSLAGFLPIGLASFVALVASARLEINRQLRSSIAWMLVLPLAYITAAFARCAERCAGTDGAQAIHNMAGMAEYVGGAIALSVAASKFSRSGHRSLSTVLWILSAGVLLCLWCIGQPHFEFRGAAQRLAETALFGFLLFFAWHGRRLNKAA